VQLPLSLRSFSRIDFTSQRGLDDREMMTRFVDAILGRNPNLPG
jgi:hypothetical protein